MSESNAQIREKTWVHLFLVNEKIVACLMDNQLPYKGLKEKQEELFQILRNHPYKREN